MNKAVIGVFRDSAAANRAINDLKANGFAGEGMHHVLRDDLRRGQKLAGPRLLPVLELLKGIIIGAIAGAIIGAVAYMFLNMSLAWSAWLWPRFGLSQPFMDAVWSFGIVGAIAGLLEGVAAAGPVASAKYALDVRNRADASLTVHTDEVHADRAAEIMRADGAVEVRRGASSMADEFRTIETVQPESYGTTPVVQREPVGAPSSGVEAGSSPEGGAIG